MKNFSLSKSFVNWLMFLTMSFIWGASFILIKKGIMAYSPQQAGALRMVFASTFFLPIAIRKVKFLKKDNILFLFSVGFLGNFIPAIMFSYGETKVFSSVASMLNSTTPIFTMIIGLIFFNLKVSFWNIIGLIIGFVGTMGLVLKEPTNILSGFNIGALAILIATFLYGINTNLVKKYAKNLDGLTISALSFLLIAPLAYIYFFSTDLNKAFSNTSFGLSTIAIFILAFFGSFLANIMFNIFILRTNAVLAASVTYVIPVFALFWGFLDGEKISLLHIFSVLIIFIGISLVNKKDAKYYLNNRKNILKKIENESVR